MKWDNDALGVTFAKSKTDQEGDHPKDAKHIYANPHLPAICPILSLGIYLLCNPDLRQNEGKQLFPGGNQSSRFSKILHAYLSKGEGLQRCISEGVDFKDIGTHSIRKGSSTYVCSGSTDSPPIAAVCLRTGWALGGVLDRYIRYESAGDQYVGRVASGLPNDARFSVLPPYFKEVNEFVLNSIKKCFPFFYNDPSLFGIIIYCLASVVHHHDWLVETLTLDHSIFNSYPLKDSAMVFKLKSIVTMEETDSFRPTGIPSRIVLMRELSSIGVTVARIPSTILDGVDKLLEDKGAMAGHVTRDYIVSAFQSCFEATGITSTLRRIEENTPNESSSTLYDSDNRTHLLMDNGRFKRLPENFVFPKEDILTCWSLWWEGNRTLNYPPFIYLNPRDIASAKERKVLSEWKSFMKYMEDTIKAKGVQHWITNPTRDEIIKMYEIARESFPWSERTSNNRKRRSGQIHLSTALKLVREAKRARLKE
jgi:hypothetical protein